MFETQNQNDATPAQTPERKPYETPVLEQYKMTAVVGIILSGAG